MAERAESGFDPHDPEIVELMEARAREQGDDPRARAPRGVVHGRVLCAVIPAGGSGANVEYRRFMLVDRVALLRQVRRDPVRHGDPRPGRGAGLMAELTALEKAKAAMAAAKTLLDDVKLDHTGMVPLADDLEFARLLRAADVNASIALVEAVDRLTLMVATRMVEAAR